MNHNYRRRKCRLFLISSINKSKTTKHLLRESISNPLTTWIDVSMYPESKPGTNSWLKSKPDSRGQDHQSEEAGISKNLSLWSLKFWILGLKCESSNQTEPTPNTSPAISNLSITLTNTFPSSVCPLLLVVSQKKCKKSSKLRGPSMKSTCIAHKNLKARTRHRLLCRRNKGYSQLEVGARTNLEVAPLVSVSTPHGNNSETTRSATNNIKQQFMADYTRNDRIMLRMRTS